MSNLPNKLTIPVLERHIVGSDRRSPENCPVNRAIQEFFGNNYDCATSRVSVGIYRPNNQFVMYRLNSEATEAITEFDNTGVFPANEITMERVV